MPPPPGRMRMKPDEIFRGLPYGFSAFEDVRDKLIECRAKARLPERAQTVISILFPYYLGEEAYRDANVSRYAVSADYHLIAGEIIRNIAAGLREEYPGFRFEPFIDNSPLPEVRCAVAAGLGVMGMNALFINPVYGSWVFLGEIVTDRYFPPARPEHTRCPGCGKCREACPGGAISENGIDPEKCLSYLSQRKGELPPEVAEKLAEMNCAWGCDVCQKVCPMNRNARVTPIEAFYASARPHVRPEDEVEGRAFAWRGPAVIARNLTAVERERGRRADARKERTDNE